MKIWVNQTMESLGLALDSRSREAAMIYSTAFITGILAHGLFFVRGSHIKQAYDIVVFHSVVGVLLYILLLLSRGVAAGFFLATTTCLLYLSGLFMSTITYRIWFHPLAAFPGPFAAKITKFYGPWIARKGRMHWEHTRLSDKYGDIARIGLFLFSNFLSKSL